MIGGGRSASIKLMAIIAALIMLTSTSVIQCQKIETIRVYLKNDGVAIVELRGTAIEGMNEIPLPIEPVIPSIETYINNTLTPSIYVNGTLFIPSTGNGSLLIRYIANTTCTNGNLQLTINCSDVVELIIEPKIILLSLPEEIVGVDEVDNNLIIKLRGPTQIIYTIAAPPPTKPPEEEKPPPEVAPKPPSIWDYISKPITLIILVAAAIIVVVVAIMRKRSSPAISKNAIDDIDRSIIDKLKKHGGTALQSEIQRELGIPKATLWRRVNKLAKLGYIEIIREGRSNKLVLKISS